MFEVYEHIVFLAQFQLIWFEVAVAVAEVRVQRPFFTSSKNTHIHSFVQRSIVLAVIRWISFTCWLNGTFFYYSLSIAEVLFIFFSVAVGFFVRAFYFISNHFSSFWEVFVFLSIFTANKKLHIKMIVRLLHFNGLFLLFFFLVRSKTKQET